MDFEFTDEQLELREAARGVLEDACPPSVPRSVFEADPPTGEAAATLWATLAALDWPGLGLPEAVGGLGLGSLEVGILVEELGRVVAPSPHLATTTQLVPFLQEAGTDLLLGGVADGSVTGTAAVAERGRWPLFPEQPAPPPQTTARSEGGGWVLEGTKSHVLDGATATELVVTAAGDAGLGVFVVPGSAVAATPMTVLDPTLPLAEVRLDQVVVEGDRVLVEPGDPAAHQVVARALQQATTAVALSTVATCRRIVELTLAYANDREQFGRPIGSFQALKHRLADCYLSVERAASLGYFAALTIVEDDDRRAMATAMAKAAAGECQRLVVRDGLQLHGGVGFTWEHDLHLWLKRAKTGDLLFGGAATHRARIAQLLGLEAA